MRLLSLPEGNGEPLTILEERTDGITLAFLVQNLGRVSPEVLEQPDEGNGEAESKILARLGKRVRGHLPRGLPASTC